MSVNKVILVGNVGKDPEVRYLDENTPVANFPLATSESYRNKEGQRVDQTEWHNVVIWRGLAKVVETYVRKGSQLYIEGKIRTRSYDDKDGNKRYITEIVADSMKMLGKREDQSGSGQSAGQSSAGNVQASGAPQQPSSGQSAMGSQQSATPQQQNPQQGGSPAGNEDPFGGNSEPDDLPF